MNPSQTAELLAYCAAFDRRTVGRADVAAWHAVLGHLGHEDAHAAVTEHYAAETRWVMPADILRGARRIRAQRITEANPVYDGDSDETPREFTRNLRQLLRAAGDGQFGNRAVAQVLPARRPELEAGRHTSRLQAVLAAIGAMPPQVVPGVVNPLAVGCPHCAAAAGRACRTSIGGRRMADPHPARADRARRSAAGVDDGEVAS